MKIKALNKRDAESAMELVQEVFFEFEAPGYSRQGIDEFLRYIEPDEIKAKMDKRQIKLWGGFEQEVLTGVIAARPRREVDEPSCFDHICLLFVKKEHHRKGVARCLFSQAKTFCVQSGASIITVNSSPYAVEAYRHLGFSTTGPENTINGIRFTPMKCEV